MSLTLHFSGWGGEAIVFGPPGLEENCSRSLSRAKRARAGWSKSSVIEDGGGFGGDLVPRVGALLKMIRPRDSDIYLR